MLPLRYHIDKGANFSGGGKLVYTYIGLGFIAKAFFFKRAWGKDIYRMALKGMMKGWIVGLKVDNNGTYVRFDGDLKNYKQDKNLVELVEVDEEKKRKQN